MIVFSSEKQQFPATDIGLLSLISVASIERVYGFETAFLNMPDRACDTSLNENNECPEAHDRLTSHAGKMQSPLKEEKDFVFFVIVPSDIVTSTSMQTVIATDTYQDK